MQFELSCLLVCCCDFQLFSELLVMMISLSYYAQVLWNYTQEQKKYFSIFFFSHTNWDEITFFYLYSEDWQWTYRSRRIGEHEEDMRNINKQKNPEEKNYLWCSNVLFLLCFISTIFTSGYVICRSELQYPREKREWLEPDFSSGTAFYPATDCTWLYLMLCLQDGWFLRRNAEDRQNRH